MQTLLQIHTSLSHKFFIFVKVAEAGDMSISKLQDVSIDFRIEVPMGK